LGLYWSDGSVRKERDEEDHPESYCPLHVISPLCSKKTSGLLQPYTRWCAADGLFRSGSATRFGCGVRDQS
jgi:hypothetical protein